MMPPPVDTIHTAETVIARLEDAGRTLIALRVPRVWPAGYRTAWPEFVAEVVTAESRSDLAPPSARAIGRMDECDGWITRWVPDERSRNLLRARSLVHPRSDKHLVSWAMLGRRLGMSHMGAKYAHDRAAARLAYALNLAMAGKMAA